MIKPTVIISYSKSQEDKIWKNRLVTQLEVLQNIGEITLWNEEEIKTDGEWFNEFKPIIDQAAVTVCLISPDYLASKFCYMEEIPYLLQVREKKKMSIIPVLLRPCQWYRIQWLEKMKVIPDDYSPDKKDYKYVSSDFKDNGDKAFNEVADEISKKINNPEYEIPKPASIWLPPEKIDINRLPMTAEELFGRQKELEMLDKAWESESTHIISLVAWGGVGKSTLVNKWLERMKADNFRGAQHVFAWTFHSQGSGEKVTSADLFFSEALKWFGDPDPVKGSPWDKGERLSQLIRKKKTLLVLDGLEPLQSPYEYERGKIKDPGMATLLTELARNNNGLCLITTREAVADLSPFAETACKRDLEQISAEAGRALLRISGVQGTDAELEAATGKFGNHALALSLLGVYLQDIKGHHISNASEIHELDIPIEKGRHPRRMMAAFEKRFGEGPEVELLKIFGLFDYPAECGAIVALRAAPKIANLTEHLSGLSEADWLRLLQKLREKKLIAPQSKYEPDALDAHPLLREHFGEKLRNTSPGAWKKAHVRLYEYYKTQAEEYPNTIEGMLPLYRAVAHACQAGRYPEAFEVYWHRIRRREEVFNLKKLEAFSDSLATISNFFKILWSLPVSGDSFASFVLNEAGYILRAMGYMKEAAQSFRAALDVSIEQEDLENVAVDANNLSELYLSIGDITIAIDYAKQSVKFADRCDFSFLKISSRTALADAMHHAGNLAEAETLFHDADKMQKKWEPDYPLLYSLHGFRYCDLLLSKGLYKKVLNHSDQTIEIAKRYNLPFEIALDHLSIGRAHLLKAKHEGTCKLSQATEHLNQAVERLRKSGNQDILLRSLLAKAELHIAQKDFEKARRDLDEAMTIAERGEMGLHQADCRLGYARLFLAMGDKEKARGELAIAKEMIGKMGYHRRDGEVKELEGQL